MKKKLPVTFWKEIQPVLEENGKLFDVTQTESYGLYFKDSDPESDFYFACEYPDKLSKYGISFKPANESNVSPAVIPNLEISELKKHIESWIKILKEYSITPALSDKNKDHIIVRYTDEFYKEIVLDEPNSDSAPFEFRRQILLQEYLVEIKGLLEDYKANPLETQIEIIEELQEECAALEETITTLPKNEVLKRISAIWAKGRKYSLDLAKKMLEEFAKECAKTVAKAALEKPEGIFEFVRGLILQ